MSTSNEFFDGWYEINTEGLSNIYLSITDEGIVTMSTDTPASKVFHGKLKNPEDFSIKRAPIAWPHGDTHGQMAGIGELQIEDYDGIYAYIVGADLRDTEIIISLPAAMAFGSATLIADAPVMVTAILDKASSPEEDTVILSLKDTLARFDRPLPMRYLPPFVDTGAANRMVPFMQGACHNFTPLLIDTPERTYIMSDASQTNVTAVRDSAALLDPNATPPQYVPVMSGSAIQLNVLPFGKLTIDATNIGSQSTIPGAVNVLGTIGDLTDWSGGNSAAPDGWDWTAHSGSLIQRRQPSDGFPASIPNMVYLQSALSWWPQGNQYGDQMSTEDLWIESGKAYRLYIKIFGTFSSAPFYSNGLRGGIQIRHALSNNPLDAISPHGQAIQEPLFGNDSYSFEFRCPIGADRKIYIIATAADGGPNVGQSNGIGGGYVYDIKLQELGEYIELPLTGINFEKYVYQVLYVRAGEDSASYSVSDLQAIDAATVTPAHPFHGYLFGNRYTEQPNILDVLQEPLNAVCGTMWTNYLGQVRFGRLVDPHDAVVLAWFDESNMDRPIHFEEDSAPNLTTLIGTTRNWDPFTDSDFIVTDYDTVPADVRARFKQTSQFQRTSAKSPAGQYAFARGAPIFDSLLDSPDDGQVEIDRVVGIWSPNVYPDGTITTGKRQFVTFTARFDDPTKLGSGLQCDVRDIGYGSGVLINYPRRGFNNTVAEVVAWELFPFGGKIVITALY